jgi:hypothetical protein
VKASFIKSSQKKGAKKTVDDHASSGAGAAWTGSGRSVEPRRKFGVKMDRELLTFSGPLAAIHAGFHYNPFTAADEKIPLSVV